MSSLSKCLTVFNLLFQQLLLSCVPRLNFISHLLNLFITIFDILFKSTIKMLGKIFAEIAELKIAMLVQNMNLTCCC